MVSIHAPYAGSDILCADADLTALIVSIHAPYAGSDPCAATPPKAVHKFQSTPPMQGATAKKRRSDIYIEVSIHAPYAGSDPCCSIAMVLN